MVFEIGIFAPNLFVVFNILDIYLESQEKTIEKLWKDCQKTIKKPSKNQFLPKDYKLSAVLNNRAHAQIFEVKNTRQKTGDLFPWENLFS